MNPSSESGEADHPPPPAGSTSGDGTQVKKRRVPPPTRVIDRIAESAYYASFRHPNGKGTTYGPKEDIPEHARPFRLKDDKECELYSQKFTESQGFDVSGCNGNLMGGVSEATHPYAMRVYSSVTNLIVKKHNEDRLPALHFLELVRANHQAAGGTMLYLTFWARTQPRGKDKLYRAKVWSRFGGDKVIFYFNEAPRVDYDNPALKRKSEDGPIDEGIEMVGNVSWDTGREKRNRPSRPTKSGAKRPFNTFVKELRKSSEFAGMTYRDVSSVAAKRWKDMSDEVKRSYKCSSGSSST